MYVDNHQISPKNNNALFIVLARQKKGTFLSVDGQIVAILHELFSFMVNGGLKSATIQHINRDTVHY